ncbi:2-hydroxy-3-oxopropionate reductase [Agrobacterium vitis]|nr:2-hydroxy-3-oxopropionate reductase [Agrobacterium vitis]MBE1437960.1 2-hydroxy-3-oxopropionate reductase [Agrobacterium vitis]
MTKIAFLGTGLMGGPMARHLAKDYTVTVWNRSIDKAQALADVAKVAHSPVEAAKDADIVISMLIDGPASRAVLKDGGTIEAAAAGALIINMASVEPDCDRALERFAKSLGKRMIDAPVSGGTKGAVERTLSIFVGGTPDDFASAKPVLEKLGRPTHMGAIGTGQTAKLANQLIVAITIGAVAEAFTLAQSAGCDIGTLREALRGGFADSRILDLHGARMVRSDFTPGGRSVAQLKDLNNALTVASESQLTLPLSEQVRSSFDDLVNNKGGAELDHAAYFLWLKQIQN